MSGESERVQSKKGRPNLRMERGAVRSTSRSSSKAGVVGHELSGLMLPMRCVWVIDHSRAPDRQFGSHPMANARLEVARTRWQKNLPCPIQASQVMAVIAAGQPGAGALFFFLFFFS